MKLFIDEKETAIELAEARTVEEAFAAFKEAIAQGRIIVEILIDGVALTENNEHEFLSKVIDSVNEVKIKTDSPNELAKTNLKEAKEYLDSFKKQIDNVIEVLQVGGEEETYDIFVDGLKGLEDVLYLIDVVKKINDIESKDLKFDDQDLDQFIDSFTSTLGEFKTALEDEDLVYMQDLLQYELKPALDIFNGFLDTILEKIN